MESGKLTHSHSQPGGMDRTPPGTPKKGGKMLAVRVQMLDDTITMFQVQAKALGKVLFDQVCNQLHLLESDYFGLEYQEVGGTKYWLDLEKPLSRQIGLSLVDTLVRFCVKFYTPDPSQLEEEFTRYLFCLQIKRDLSQGLLQCNSNTAALMASYIVQAECGDYVVEDYPDHRYLSTYKFVPNQDQELERRIMENHKKHAGQSPAEADLNLLETARRCELYGIKMHAAKDHDGEPLNLAVAHMGIVVFQNFTKINTFSWAKIRKISFKRKKFLVKLHPEGYGYYKDTVEFFFEGRNECKNFWKKCVENHGFFRCSMVKKVPRQKTRVLSRGSSFRYSGRTQKQIVEFVRENYVKRQTFQRSQSFRHSSSAHSSVANVGTSISAHPLLPLGDNAVAGTPASLSCGSMTLTSSPLHTADIHAGGSPSPPLTTSVSPGTSVTSSPQHFYPQETPYRRAGHQHSKVKHPHVRSHHAISPLQSPTSAATAASNRSANLSNNNSNNNNNNNNVIVDSNDVKSSRISLKSSDYANFNDVYSNCYSSLRSLRHNADDNEINDNETKSDMLFDLPATLFPNSSSKSNESIRPPTKKPKPSDSDDAEDVDGRYRWHRSVSCKDLYHEENLVTESKNEKNLIKMSEKPMRYENEVPYEIGFDSPVTRYDETRRKCYSAVTSKNSSVDRTGDAASVAAATVADMKIYSSSYPGTTSSLSTESAEGETEDRIIEIVDVKYDSQEEMVLSHDDVSHDSYELLERELEDYDDDSFRNKSKKTASESDRTRSCSWGSDRGMVPLDSRSIDNVISPSFAKSQQNGFWSLEREKSPKHKSEIDFRSLDRKVPKRPKTSGRTEEHRSTDRTQGCGSKRGRSKEFLDYETRCFFETKQKSKEMEEKMFGMTNRVSPLESRIPTPKGFEDRELYRTFEQEARLRVQVRDYEQENFERKMYLDRRRNREDLEVFTMEGDSVKGEQIRYDERKRFERKRDKRDKEERFHEGIKEKEQKEWEREKDKRQMERRKNAEEIQRRNEDEVLAAAEAAATTTTTVRKTNDYANFQEIHFKKFDRVVSNQFGKYSEFLIHENSYDLLLQERKVVENYEKVCQVGRIAKELEKSQRVSLMDAECQKIVVEDVRGLGEEEELKYLRRRSADVTQFREYPAKTKGSVVLGFAPSPRGSPKFGKPLVERTKSDPYDSNKNLRRNVLMHQKSIDLTPQQSEETTSDYDNEDYLKKTSRSEHDIPYILHKRHCMNGTAKNVDLTFSKSDIIKSAASSKSVLAELRDAAKTCREGNMGIGESGQKSSNVEEVSKVIKPKGACAKGLDNKKSLGSKVNVEAKSKSLFVNAETKPTVKPTAPKKPTLAQNKEVVPSKNFVRPKEAKKSDFLKVSTSAETVVVDKVRMDAAGEISKNVSKATEAPSKTVGGAKEPIYAEVCKGKIMETKEIAPGQRKIPPEPPKRTSSVQQKSPAEEKSDASGVAHVKTGPKVTKSSTEKKTPPEPPKRTTSAAQKPNVFKSSESKQVIKAVVSEPIKSSVGQKEAKVAKTETRGKTNFEETGKSSGGSVAKGKQTVAAGSASNAILQRREESLILFARTRLGLSEGSAFAPIVRQGHVGSPAFQRRTKSLDAPFVSVHRLPPVTSFSSKDDTVENEGDIVQSGTARAKDLLEENATKMSPTKSDGAGEAKAPAAASLNGESEMDSVFPDVEEVESNFKKTVESQSKVDIPFTEEKVLDSVRSKRLLSKIESVDGMDSEGDMDSSKLADPLPIPSDRLVNLPESVRFPSVRQISGQTSEESADGWDQKEIKVKRRTPRRSVGREDPDDGVKESVVWDSKDEEPPDDDVWDDSLVFGGKHEGSAVADAVVPTEYLKRGSCGQSIDDDNLSTPMKESSPEHWVSVDDLPEALEREEKLLRQQEKILREKILNEKLKRELNLDTIDVDERYCDYKESFRQRQEEESMGPKDKFKGHSLDTYELTEKKLRERVNNKNSSLDEHLLGNKLIKNYVSLVSALDASYENVMQPSKYQRKMDYIHCKVVNDVTEIDQFGDNDEDLEEFFVVLDENLESGKDGREAGWDDEDTFRENTSKEVSLISVPEEFKDVEEEEEEEAEEIKSEGHVAVGQVEIRLSEVGETKRLMTGEEHILACQLLQDKLDSVSGKNRNAPADDTNKLTFHEVKVPEESKLGLTGEVGRLSPYGGSRRGSEERRKSSATEDTGRLSPYDYSSRRSSDDPRRLSASDEAGRLSPFNDSRRGSEDPRRLSASEDSRKYSISESVSEETRRRLSSTEETRRKRASLTKQCSVGADSLSDDVISGIQECSSSFEHDEKDVFEAEPETVKSKEKERTTDSEVANVVDVLEGVNSNERSTPLTELPQVKQLEIEVSEDVSSYDAALPDSPLSPHEDACEAMKAITHLAPPTTERELSRETEDSVDYGEGDFKEIRDAVKEKDISGDVTCNAEATKSTTQTSKVVNSFEKSESSECDELRYIDEKRGSTPEIIVGKSREAIAMSVVVVNEGISVLNKIVEKDRWLNEVAKAQSLPREKIAVTTAVEKDVRFEDQRHTLPKSVTKPKPLSPKPSADFVQRKLRKNLPNVKVSLVPSPVSDKSISESLNVLKSSLDSSLESDIDKMSDVSLISHVQSQIVRRNLSDTGKRLRRDEFGEGDKENVNLVEVPEQKASSEEEAANFGQRTSSEEREKTESSSFELRSSADEFGVGEDGLWRSAKGEKRFGPKSGLEKEKSKRESGSRVGKEQKSPEQEKRDSGEDGSSSSSAPAPHHPKRELSSTWKPFLLESSGSSSLEEGWLPPDDNAHLADEEETSSTSNNQQDDSYHDDIDYPTGIGYPVLNMSSAEMMVGGYGSVYALSRTLSRISERSTSEQERSDAEDDITKPSSHSASVEEESIMSSDHQPSLSSDPPSPRESTSRIPDLPDDGSSIPECFAISEDRKTVVVVEPFGDVIPPPVPDEDWPSPPSSSSVFDTPVVSHIETFYMEIHPEEACKVVVAEPHNQENSSSDENQTLHEEGELLHLSSDNVSASTTTTTQDGTVIIPIRPRSARTGSASEDTSVVSTSEWTVSGNAKVRSGSSGFAAGSEDPSDRIKCSSFQESGGKGHHRKLSSEDVPDRAVVGAYRQQSQSCYSFCEEAGGSRTEGPGLPRGVDVGEGGVHGDRSQYYPESFSQANGQKPKIPVKIKPPKLKSPPGKSIGFFETPVSKVRSPTFHTKFFEGGDRVAGASNLRSPTSHSETTSPKNHGRFFEGSGGQISRATEPCEYRKSKSPTKSKHDGRKEGKIHQRNVCTPYYSNVADFAEKSYFGRYDTGSLERTKLHSSRKCCSYYSVSKTAPSEEDSSNSEGPRTPSSNTIPRASKKTKKRHRVAMDLEIRDGKIVAPPKTRTTVLENSDSDRSSPRAARDSRTRTHSDV